MTTRYQMKEMPDLQGTGEPITYPKMVMTGQTGTRELAEYIAMTSGFSKGVTEGIICELGEALAQGWSKAACAYDRIHVHGLSAQPDEPLEFLEARKMLYRVLIR